MSPDEVSERNSLFLAVSPFSDEEEGGNEHDLKEEIELDQVCGQNSPYHSQGVESVEAVVQPVPSGIVANPLTHVRDREERDQSRQEAYDEEYRKTQIVDSKTEVPNWRP